MQQAVELFEILQERRARIAPTMNMVEAQPIGTIAEGAEPLPFLTLTAVEGITRAQKMELH